VGGWRPLRSLTCVRRCSCQFVHLSCSALGLFLGPSLPSLSPLSACRSLPTCWHLSIDSKEATKPNQIGSIPAASCRLTVLSTTLFPGLSSCILPRLCIHLYPCQCLLLDWSGLVSSGLVWSGLVWSGLACLPVSLSVYLPVSLSPRAFGAADNSGNGSAGRISGLED